MGRKAPTTRKEKAQKKTKKPIKRKEELSDEVEIIEDEKFEETDEDDVQNDGKMEDGEEEALLAPTPSTSRKHKVVFAHNAIVDIGWDCMEQVYLPHPKTGQEALYIIDTNSEGGTKGKHFLYEVMSMVQDTRSWFIGESVVSDGNIYLSTPMDPLFFVLPIIMKTTQGMPLRDHLSEAIKNTKFVDILCSRLEASGQLDHISKKIVCDDITAYKFLEDKTLNWLTEKVIKTSEFLSKKDITSSEASVSSNFIRSSTPASAEKKKEEYIRYACEILGDYLPEELKRKLFEKLGLPLTQEQDKSNKRKSELEDKTETGGSTKKFKVDSSDDIQIQPNEDYGSSNNINLFPQSNTKIKTKNKELQKAAKGTQSLFKFFTPKAK